LLKNSDIINNHVFRKYCYRHWSRFSWFYEKMSL